MSAPIKERILASFRELSLKKGIRATTVDELAAHADISKRTLYRYFRSKEEIVDTFFSLLMKDIDWQVNLITTGKGDPVYKFKSITKLMSKSLIPFQQLIADDLSKYYPNIWAKFGEFRNAKLCFLEALVREGVRQGYFRPLNPRLVSAGFLAVANTIISPDFLADNSMTISEAMDQLSDFFLFGLSIGGKIQGS